MVDREAHARTVGIAESASLGPHARAHARARNEKRRRPRSKREGSERRAKTKENGKHYKMSTSARFIPFVTEEKNNLSLPSSLYSVDHAEGWFTREGTKS